MMAAARNGGEVFMLNKKCPVCGKEYMGYTYHKFCGSAKCQKAGNRIKSNSVKFNPQLALVNAQFLLEIARFNGNGMLAHEEVFKFDDLFSQLPFQDHAMFIRSIVAENFNLEPGILSDKIGLEVIKTARHVACYISYKFAGSTQKKIGNVYNKNHETIYNAITKIKEHISPVNGKIVDPFTHYKVCILQEQIIRGIEL